MGHWKRVDNPSPSGYSLPASDAGDLIIFSDSTFVIGGGAPADSSKIPGWNAGGTLTGLWSLHHNKLVFKFDGRDDWYNLPSTIRKLTSKELTLDARGGKSKGGWEMRYVRKIE